MADSKSDQRVPADPLEAETRARLRELAQRVGHGLFENADGQHRAGEFEEREAAVRRTIRERRVAAGLSQQVVADRMTAFGFRMGQTSITKIEAGQRPLRLAELFALADALEVPWVALVSPARTMLDEDADAESLRRAVDSAHETQRMLEARFTDSLRIYARAYNRAQLEELYLAERLAQLSEPNGARDDLPDVLEVVDVEKPTSDRRDAAAADADQ